LCSFTVTVNDTEVPTISCPANITATVNSSGCSSVINYSVSYNDNCPGAALLQTSGLASGSSFPTGSTTNTFVVTDASGNSATCSFTVTVNTSLGVAAGMDETTYFGYSGDQTVVRNVTASGGTSPYQYSWALSRPLLCNQINSNGDEAFSGGSCLHNICPSSGSLTSNAVCTGSSSVTTKLMDDADVCVTVTDNYGCTVTDCFTVFAIDARCFAGNSNNEKVQVCHHTNSSSNPWVVICIPSEAVASHLANNPDDYIGSCYASRLNGDEQIVFSGIEVYPNPAMDKLHIKFNSEQTGDYTINVVDLAGRIVINHAGKAQQGINKKEFDLSGITKGLYMVELKSISQDLHLRIVVQ
jgi:hypothetical protein